MKNVKKVVVATILVSFVAAGKGLALDWVKPTSPEDKVADCLTNNGFKAFSVKAPFDGEYPTIREFRDGDKHNFREYDPNQRRIREINFWTDNHLKWDDLSYDQLIPGSAAQIKAERIDQCVKSVGYPILKR